MNWELPGATVFSRRIRAGDHTPKRPPDSRGVMGSFDPGRKTSQTSRLLRSLFVSGILGCLLSLPAPVVTAACPTLVGDLTNDDQVNIVDVQCDILIVLYYLSDISTAVFPPCLDPPEVVYADINCDGSVAVTDVVLLITLALGMPLDPAVDTNGDGCADACEAALTPVLNGTPTFVIGTSTGGDYILRSLGTAAPSPQTSSGNDYQLSPRLWGIPTK